MVDSISTSLISNRLFPFPLFISESQRDILSFHLLPTPLNSPLSFSLWLAHKSLHPSHSDLATHCLVLMAISGHWGHSLLHPTNNNTQMHKNTHSDTRKHRANDLCCISSLPSHTTGIEVKLSTQRALWEHSDSVDERDAFHCGSIGGQKSQSTALLSL